MHSIHNYLLVLLATLLLFSCRQEGIEQPVAQPVQPEHREEVVMTEQLNFLIRPTNASVVAAVDSVQPRRTAMEGTLELNGIITYDTRNVFTIPARVVGRIEKLYVRYNFQPVKKGQKLLEIYSPELVTAQKELLFLLNNDAENTQLIQGAEQKLRLLGATEAQINQLIRSENELYTFTIYSPYNGYVTIPGAVQQQAPMQQPASTPGAGAGGGMDGMGGSASPSPAAAPAQSASPQEFNLREGMYVGTGQTLFQVINNEQLWAEFNVPARSLQHISKGTPVSVTVPQLSEKPIQTQVDLVQPYFQGGENFARIRARIPAQQNITLAGQLVQAQVSYKTAPSLWVPKEAVLNIGNATVAFRKINGTYIPVTVQSGSALNDMVEVTAGLTEQDVIAANAQFLVDSDSFIKVRD